MKPSTETIGVMSRKSEIRGEKTNKKQDMSRKKGLRLNIQISCSFHGDFVVVGVVVVFSFAINEQ